MNEDPLEVLTSSGEIIEPAREVVVGGRRGIPRESPPLLRYPHVIQIISRGQDAFRHHVPQVTDFTRWLNTLKWKTLLLLMSSCKVDNYGNKIKHHALLLVIWTAAKNTAKFFLKPVYKSVFCVTRSPYL